MMQHMIIISFYFSFPTSLVSISYIISFYFRLVSISTLLVSILGSSLVFYYFPSFPSFQLPWFPISIISFIFALQTLFKGLL